MRAVMGMERRMRRNGGERTEDFLYNGKLLRLMSDAAKVL